MNTLKNYFKLWLYQIGEFRKYRNTLICILAVCLITLFHRHHRLDMLISLGQYQVYFIPLTFLFYGLTLLIIPLLTAPLLLPADRFGFRIGNFRTWRVDVAVAWLVVFVLILIFCRTPVFLRTYPLFKPPGNQWTWKLFLFYQVCQFIYMFGWEFIFRGYLLFSTKRELGIIPALILQMVPFAFLHLGKPEMEVYGSVLAGLFLGMIALRANSFLPCVFLHFSVALTMDLFAVFLTVQGGQENIFRGLRHFGNPVSLLSSDGIFKGLTGDSGHGSSGPGHCGPAETMNERQTSFPALARPGRVAGSIIITTLKTEDRVVIINALNPGKYFLAPPERLPIFYKRNNLCQTPIPRSL